MPDQLPAAPAGASPAAMGSGAGPSGPPPVPPAQSAPSVMPDLAPSPPMKSPPMPLPGVTGTPAVFTGGPEAAPSMTPYGTAAESPTEQIPSAPSTIPHRPVGLVWIVFYWTISGVAWMVAGLLWMGIAVGLGGLAMGIQGLGGTIRDREVQTAGIAIRLLNEGVAALSLCAFYLGLFTLVVCYGLWSFRKWGLTGARVLSIVYAVLAGLSLFSLIVGASVVLVLVNLIISIWIMIYFYGMQELSERVRRYYDQLRQTKTPAWTEFR
ncbi:MAG: hypothetical protein NZ602_11875 [Thermoguttaceae bacterium]|nr:hypothetical protein [Thermoguttaceae bacterium]